MNDTSITELDALIEAKYILSSIPTKQQSVEYENINFKINCILHKRCEHTIITDTIDINTEKSETICYCDKCYLTFSVQFFYDYLLYNLDINKREQWKIITDKGIYDISNIFIENENLCIQIPSTIWIKNNDYLKFSLKDIVNCRVDHTIVYIN